MIRVLIYLALLAVLAYCGMWLVEHPGHVTVDWFGAVVSTSAALLIIAVAIAAILIWSVTRFVLGLPSFISVFRRQRRREKGYAALSRGLIAVNAGDARTAGKASTVATKHLRNDPLAMMLRAQAAYMNEDDDIARASFETLAQREDGRVLGLRGLHDEAVRRGDDEAAHHFAAAAHRTTPLPWSARAVLEHHAATSDWETALATVETSIAAKLIDKPTGERQRAVLETAIAQDKEAVSPDEALALARRAMRRAPDLAPPVALAARLLSRRGEIGKASKLIEKAWPRCQHPDVARAYLDVRPGDSTTDRLTRARTLMAIASFDPVSRMLVARAALANRDFAAGRAAMAPLIAEGKRPSVRMCLLMAELEETEHGDLGSWREWMARASRAPLDPAWVCDGVVYDRWAPASPTTGKLDAFAWQVPAERLGPAMEAMPAPPRHPAEVIETIATDPAPRALPATAKTAATAETLPAETTTDEHAPAEIPPPPVSSSDTSPGYLFRRDEPQDQRHQLETLPPPSPASANGSGVPAAHDVEMDADASAREPVAKERQPTTH